jgi:hypothetical protein
VFINFTKENLSMKFAKLCFVALALCAASCQQPATNENTAKPASDAKTAAATPAPAALDLSTPTKAAVIFYQGVRDKDAEKVIRSLSKETLEEAKKQSADTGKTIMEAITQSAPPPASMPDTRNEKVDGNTATLEVVGLDAKDNNKAEKFYFVKEGNDWKVDLFHEEKDGVKKDAKE